MTQLVYNRFRLTRPMKRVGGEKGSPDSKFEPIDWDEALETIATNSWHFGCWGSAGDREQDFWQVATRYRFLLRALFKLLGSQTMSARYVTTPEQTFSVDV